MAGLLVAGTPESVQDEIEKRAREAGADEVMVATIVHDPVARLRSYELLGSVCSRTGPLKMIQSATRTA
jgi:alkanesulfonate monooxygenase SsuD/methylene tetrahydromethanopterin reductase-like flavin-dependent oxidoreductase (luciferase family)